MATQTPAPRTWFRLPSVVRGPASPAAPAPEPPAPQPRAPLIRAPFRPMGLPQPQPQPQESAPAPEQPALGVSSVPTSPVRRTSLPPSPVSRTSPPATVLPAPSSPPKSEVSAPSSFQPTSPTLKPPASPPKPSTSSMPTSPPKPAPPTFAAPISPPKPAPPTFAAPISPPKPAPPTYPAPTSPPKPAQAAFAAPTSPPKPAPATFSPQPSPPKPAPPTFSVPTSPPKPAPPTFSVPTSPPKPAPSNLYSPISPLKPEAAVTTTIRVPSPPRTIKPADKSPPRSPYKKPTAPPPSPLVLPPLLLSSKKELEPTIPAETEQKTVLVHTTSEKPKPWVNGDGNRKDFEEAHKPSSHPHHGNHHLHKDVAEKEKGHWKKSSSESDHDMGMRVITIAGENKGAFMEVIRSPLKHRFGGNNPHTLQKTDSGSSSDEGKSKKDKNQKSNPMLSSAPTDAFMNSNVQGVNNSIVFNSSCSHHDPGVHLSLSRKPYGNGFHVKDKSNGHHS